MSWSQLGLLRPIKLAKLTLKASSPPFTSRLLTSFRPRYSTMQLEYFLLLAAALFCVGIYGLVTSRNVIRVLMSIELMLNAVNINLMAFSNYLDPAQIKGQVFSVFVMTIAAAEAAVGLAIVLSIYRNRDTVDMEQFNLLKW